MTHLDSKKLGSVIRVLRDQKGISQEELSRSLGIPRPSLSQLENGQRDLSFDEMRALLGVLQVSYEEFLAYCQPKAARKEAKISTQKHKIQFDPGKFKQMLLYILERCGSKPNVGETVLYKLLYFCDFDFFELYEKPLTGMPYRRYQFGPVPDQAFYNPVIAEMIKGGLIQRVSRPYVMETTQTRYISFAKADMRDFSNEETETINRVINRLSDMSARQIEDHAHHDIPWMCSVEGEVIDYSAVFSREGEYAQRDLEAEFLQAGAQDAFGGLEPMTKGEYEYYINLSDPRQTNEAR